MAFLLLLLLLLHAVILSSVKPLPVGTGFIETDVAVDVAKATACSSLIQVGHFHSKNVSLNATHARPGLHKGDLREHMLQICLPATALLGGSVVMLTGLIHLAMLLIYFGSQTGFSIYMKLLLSNASVSEALGYHGVPAAFAVTGIQQVVTFVFIAGLLCMLYPTSYRYQVKRITKRREVFAVFALAVASAANIGLNNLSLSYLPLSTVVMFRSSIPLVTYMFQKLASKFQTFPNFAAASTAEVSLMIMGALFASLCAVAQTAGASPSGEGQSFQLLGVLVVLCSLAAGALNLVLADYLSSSLNFNPIDIMWYMTIPAAMILFMMGFIPHPCEWRAFSPATDWAVVAKVMQLSPETMLYILASGIMAGGFNMYMYLLVKTLSAPHVAFAGNVNKAATIAISLVFGLEGLPKGRRMAGLMIISIAGNILAFTAYSLIRTNAKHAEQAGASLVDKQQCSGLPVIEKNRGKGHAIQ